MFNDSSGYFNTSYVSVLRLTGLLRRAFVRDFNTSYVSVLREEAIKGDGAQDKFQYIICIGSTYKKDHALQMCIDFNTSYVSVLRPAFFIMPSAYIYFNTSYVSVLP